MQTQIHRLPKLWKIIPILTFSHFKSKSNLLFSSTLKTIPTLASIYYERKSNSMFPTTLEINPNIGFLQIQWFPRLWKQILHWLPLIKKAIQIQWFPHLRIQIQHWLPLIAKAIQSQWFPCLIYTLKFVKIQWYAGLSCNV
jgi:hypothetical protein